MKITKGTRAFLTGAGSGIGRASAIELAELGCELFLTDINARGLEETRGMISDKPGRVCKSRAFDIRDLSAVKAFADEIHQEFGPMDIVMNIAGIALFAQIEDMTHQHWEKVIGVNLWGPIHCIECFLPEMIRVKKGHLVNVASIAGLTGAPWHAAYSTSKWGLAGLSEVLRYDLMQHNIGVTLVCPGAVDTPLKYSAEILGADKTSPRVQSLIQKFNQHTVPPEKVARMIIRAVEKKKFLVITSADVKFAYFCKHHLFPLYHYFLIRISHLLNSMREPNALKNT